MALEIKQLLIMGNKQLETLEYTNTKLDKSEKKAIKARNKLDVVNSKLDIVTKEVTYTRKKLDLATDDMVPKTSNEDKREVFVILENTATKNPSYYCIRRQIETLDKAILQYSSKYKEGKVAEFLRITNPNSVNLLIRIKETLHKKINYEYNSITLKKNITNPITKEEFREEVFRINEEKKDMYYSSETYCSEDTSE